MPGRLSYPLVAVRFKVSAETSQEFHGIEFCPGLRVFIEDDHGQLCLLLGFIKQVQLPGDRFGFSAGSAEQFPGQVFHLLTQAGDCDVTFFVSKK